ncbi:MAG: VIT1/CCC1 family protein [Dehalococcoidia bacterium]
MAQTETPPPPPTGSDRAVKLDINAKLLIENYHGELDAAALYRALAHYDKSKERAKVLLEIAESEDRHAAVMSKRLGEMGVKLPKHRTGLRVRVLSFLARVFGAPAILPMIETFEAGDVDAYASSQQDPVVQELVRDERSHFRAVGSMTRPATGNPADIVRHERWHRSSGGGTLRASIFGVSDGLVSNLALVMGFTGAGSEGKFVVLAGIAGLLAGAGSMAAGEYVSMRAQRELFERQISLEETELLLSPDEERAELALIYRAKGIPADEAEVLAGRILEDKDVALDTLAREELGLDPSALGSPWSAAIGSFLAFAVGAIVPVIAYFSGNSWLHFGISAGMSAVALFAVGVGVSLFTGKNSLYSGGRQLAIGAATAALTYGVGTAIGAGTGI